MKTQKFFVENLPFLCYVDSSKNADFINNGFFANSEKDAINVAYKLIELHYGIDYANNPDWYVSDGSNLINHIDASCAYLD